MLNSISIKNFAIIEDLDVSFSSNMTILTGETGAGKSILIDALSLLVGERSSFDKIRTGATKAIIEGEFIIKNPSLLKEISEKYGEDILDGNSLLVSRTLDISGRSVVRVNGVQFPLNKLKTMMSELIDIHSQHQNLLILDERKHLSLLDEYMGDSKEKKAYLEAFEAYKIAKKALKSLENDRISESDALIIKDQISELEAANIEIGEISRLEEEKERLMSSQKISDAIRTFLSLSEDEQGILTKMYLAKKELERSGDEKLIEYSEKLDNLYYEMKDLSSSIGYELETFMNSSYRLEEIDDRLYFLKRLVRKYRGDEEDLLSLLEDLKEKLYKVDHFERLYLEKEQEVTKLYNIAFRAGKALTEARKESASKLSAQVDQELHDLSLIHGQFIVNFESEEQMTSSGLDKVYFLLTTNKGLAPSPLKNVASGGETSRIMLALKTIFGRLSHMETIIFDEVDTGVSGKVAMQVARKMKEIASYCQVLTISHLPQVASIADHHYLVIKEVENEITKSRIINLIDEEVRIHEIAKLLSGTDVTNASLEAARELIKEAKN